jgi:hypothetical protein
VIELGIETVDITPEIDTRLSGFAARANKPSTGIEVASKEALEQGVGEDTQWRHER